MPNFNGSIAASNASIKSGIKGVFNLNGSNFSLFIKSGNLANFRNFVGSKEINNNSTTTPNQPLIRTTGQLFP